jgi:hypothetical protein
LSFSANGARLTFLTEAGREAVVYLFLRLLHEGEFDNGPFIGHGQPLVAFLREWNCAIELKRLASIIAQSALPGARFPVVALRAFAVCAAAENEAACKTILSNCHFEETAGQERARYPSHSEYLAFDGASLDSSRWPLYMWTEVPAAWAMALTHAVGITNRHVEESRERLDPVDNPRHFLADMFVERLHFFTFARTATHLVLPSWERARMEWEH